MKVKTDFDYTKPYKVIAVISESDIKFKITQPLRLWLFGLTSKYYDVCEWILRSKYKRTKYFKNKEEIDLFIQNQSKIVSVNSEYIVYDSLNDIIP